MINTPPKSTKAIRTAGPIASATATVGTAADNVYPTKTPQSVIITVAVLLNA